MSASRYETPAEVCLWWARSYRQRAAETAFPAVERHLLEQAEWYEQQAKEKEEAERVG